MPRFRVATSVVFAALAMTVFACGPDLPTPSPSPLPFPSPRAGAPVCPPAGDQQGVITRLAEGGITVSAVSSSTGEALFPEARSVCLLDVGTASFEAAFFIDARAASAVRVCETAAGNRHLYQVSGHTVDAAFPLYWTIAGGVLAWTSSRDLDRSLTQVLGGTRPRC
jgi:hypothetical protein